MTLTFQPCTLAWAAQYVEMIREHIAADGAYPFNNYPLALSDFPAYVAELEEEAAGIGLPPHIPAQRTLLIIGDETRVIGEFRFRPRLVAAIPPENQNGHIGYNLRPSLRGQGIGTRVIALAGELGRQHGLDRIYLTIDPENCASIRVTEKNGGRLVRGELYEIPL